MTLFRIAGAALLMLAGGAAGAAMLSEMNARLRLIGDLAAALGVIKSEICSLQTPLPEVFESLSLRGPAATRDFFSHLAGGICAGELRGVWDEQVKGLEIGEEAELCLMRLGLSLGRYEAQRQALELDAARSILEQILADRRVERDRQRRVYPGLGVSAGALIAVILL